MSVSQFFQELQDLAKYEAKQMQTLPADNETFTVEFHVDWECPALEDLNHKIKSSTRKSDAVCIIVEDVDSALIDSLQDDELAEFFGIDREHLIYTNRGEL